MRQSFKANSQEFGFKLNSFIVFSQLKTEYFGRFALEGESSVRIGLITQSVFNSFLMAQAKSNQVVAPVLVK